jgi:hypothetical protein
VSSIAKRKRSVQFSFYFQIRYHSGLFSIFMKGIRVFELAIEGPEVRTHKNVSDVIQSCYAKINQLYINYGGKGLYLHHVRVGVPQSIGVDREKCHARRRVGFILSFTQIDKNEDISIIQKVKEVLKD